MKAGLLAASEQDVAVCDARVSPFRRRGEFLQGVREQFIVLIEKKKPVASGGSNGCVSVGGKTAVFLASDALDASAVASSNLRGCIGTAVIADDYFVGRTGLTQNTFDGCGQRGGAVVCGNDDARCHLSSLSGLH